MLTTWQTTRIIGARQGQKAAIKAMAMDDSISILARVVGLWAMMKFYAPNKVRSVDKCTIPHLCSVSSVLMCHSIELSVSSVLGLCEIDCELITVLFWCPFPS